MDDRVNRSRKDLKELVFFVNRILENLHKRVVYLNGEVFEHYNYIK